MGTTSTDPMTGPLWFCTFGTGAPATGANGANPRGTKSAVGTILRGPATDFSGLVRIFFRPLLERNNIWSANDPAVGGIEDTSISYSMFGRGTGLVMSLWVKRRALLIRVRIL